MNQREYKTQSPVSSRREFVKNTTAALAATAAVSRLASVARAAGSEEVKVALIGCGGRGTGAAHQAMSTEGPVKLWAMADAFDDALDSSRERLIKGGRVSRASSDESMAERMDIPPERRFTGLDAYKAIMDLDEIDMVILTTPPGFRPLHFEAAVNAGKHVFMEKPVCVDAPGYRRVMAANEIAKRKGLKVAVGLNRRHDPTYNQFVDRVHDGAIGRLITLRIYYNAAGVGHVPRREPEWTEMQTQVHNWYYYTWLSGDHIVEQHVHNIDAACWLKGEYPVRAQGQGGRQVRTEPGYGQIYDHHFVEYEFADGARCISQCRHIRGCWNYVGEGIDGDKGVAEAGRGGASIRLYGQDAPLWEASSRLRASREPIARSVNSYQIEHDKLFASIRSDTPHNEAEYGAKSSMAAVMGRMATYSGQEITWEQAINSQNKITTDDTSWDAEPPVLPHPDGTYPVAMPGVTRVL